MNGPVRLLVLDVDGVLTDGTIYIDDAGRQMRGFHIQDGLGITLWKAVGGKVAILTSKRSEAVMTRARMLGIDLVEQGAEDKLPGFERILAATGVTAEQTAYMGDDLLDAVVMRRAGYPIAVANAVDEIKQIARHVTQRPGGQAAVREAVEHLLKSAGHWTMALAAIGANR
ncbi:MAG TPA: HAD-IIIA family hydrolase [Phycisphaerae bacterium]|jgi:3-deoxy-D-manno-octulosonate 8-phosphate phosphatase (KDO 8-P phosphatase)|nr:HAD-IIIA family hydrolase [Phycisphaerae bacterium]HOB73130.1 HAD-IIIA family hydrolase [Phycisphaerae bacterium]HOJ53990.1 HAD-IIIA family hydrolase [Phycisphaerae bacterium]HOL27186.1 HAD-IIIA family hydrolase [Phycisphaerae bacterium]HPP22902.1 HAD-IIIA family hydrolase [Phycisphaerae bacterium]